MRRRFAGGSQSAAFDAPRRGLVERHVHLQPDPVAFGTIASEHFALIFECHREFPRTIRNKRPSGEHLAAVPVTIHRLGLVCVKLFASTSGQSGAMSQLGTILCKSWLHNIVPAANEALTMAEARPGQDVGRHARANFRKRREQVYANQRQADSIIRIGRKRFDIT